MVYFEQINAPSILARTLIRSSEISLLQTIICNNDRVVVTPFDVETAGTLFEDNPVAILSKNRATANIITNFASYLNKLRDIDISAIQNYLKSHELFFDIDNTGTTSNDFILIRFLQKL